MRFEHKFFGQIPNHVRRGAEAVGARDFDPAIAAWLVELGEEKLRFFTTTAERLAQATQRLDLGDGERAIKTLMRFAAEIARRKGHTRIFLADAKTAYEEHFCSFWPFC